MKTLHTALLASSFLFVTYVAAPAPAHAGGWRCAQLSDAGRAEKQTDSALDVALATARRGLPIRLEVDELKTAVGVESFTYMGVPDQCVLQMMLDQEIAELEARAASYMAHEADLRQLQVQMVLGRYERALHKIKMAWKNGEIAEDIALQAMGGLRIDAVAYLESIGQSSIADQLAEAIALLIARGQDAMKRTSALQDTFKTLYELRVKIAAAVLEARIASGKFNKLDYERLQKALAGLEKLHTSPQPNDCGS